MTTLFKVIYVKRDRNSITLRSITEGMAGHDHQHEAGAPMIIRFRSVKPVMDFELGGKYYLDIITEPEACEE